MGFYYSKPPCKGCENRHEKCHTVCPEYAEWAKSRKEIEEKARTKYQQDYDVDSYIIKGSMKNRRRNNRKGW